MNPLAELFSRMLASHLACRLNRSDIGTHLLDRKSTRLNSSHLVISYAVFCLKKKNYLNHPISLTLAVASADLSYPPTRPGFPVRASHHPDSQPPHLHPPVPQQSHVTSPDCLH